MLCVRKYFRNSTALSERGLGEIFARKPQGGGAGTPTVSVTTHRTAQLVVGEVEARDKHVEGDAYLLLVVWHQLVDHRLQPAHTQLGV